MAGDYKFKPADFEKISTYPIKKRKSLVKIDNFSDLKKYDATGRFTDLLPSILKADDLKDVVDAVRTANKNGKPVVMAMGAHVIKCGLSPIIIEMMERGIINALAFNGAGAVHDMEIAYHGATSEDVASEIKSGRFGMVEETGAHFNAALKKMETAGMGETLGSYIVKKKMPHADMSLLARGFKLDIPVTIHVAIGSDITHAGPGVDGEAIGRATLNDFKLFTGVVSRLKGGVYFNIGSSVVLPEVFIKALSAARNLGEDVSGFMTVNMDMIQSYRPRVNVVNRPVSDSGRGVSLTGHHEIMIPLLYHLLTSEKS